MTPENDPRLNDPKVTSLFDRRSPNNFLLVEIEEPQTFPRQINTRLVRERDAAKEFTGRLIENAELE